MKAPTSFPHPKPRLPPPPLRRELLLRLDELLLQLLDRELLRLDRLLEELPL